MTFYLIFLFIIHKIRCDEELVFTHNILNVYDTKLKATEKILSPVAHGPRSPTTHPLIRDCTPKIYIKRILLACLSAGDNELRIIMCVVLILIIIVIIPMSLSCIGTVKNSIPIRRVLIMQFVYASRCAHIKIIFGKCVNNKTSFPN